MKKMILFITLIVTFINAMGETPKYNFKMKEVRIVDAKLSQKNNGGRTFSGLIENKTRKNITVTLDIYFKDPEVNNGREVLVSSPIFYNIPARSTKTFNKWLSVGPIDGRDFDVRLSKIKELK
jgi:hypothetical protein